jgi:hypothetical protein
MLGHTPVGRYECIIRWDETEDFVTELSPPHIIRSTATARRPDYTIGRHTFAVHVLEAWVCEGKDSKQKLPVLSGYMGHAPLKSTELYLRLVPDRFVKPLATLQKRRRSE